MAFRSLMTERRKRIALIAHDNMKPDILEWATYNRGTLGRHELFATGTTGALMAAELGLKVHRFRSGPLGGDQQVGAGVAEGKIDFIIFFWIPRDPHPHDVDGSAPARGGVSTGVASQSRDCRLCCRTLLGWDTRRLPGLDGMSDDRN